MKYAERIFAELIFFGVAINIMCGSYAMHVGNYFQVAWAAMGATLGIWWLRK